MGASVMPTQATQGPLRFDQLSPDRQAGIRANIAKMQAANAPEADIDEYLSKHEGLAAAVPDAPPASAAPRSTFNNALNTVDNALTFGLGQKFNAAWNATADKLTGRDGFWHSYDANLDAEHAGINELKSEHPYGSALLGAAGTVPAMALAAPAEGADLAGSGIGAMRSAAQRMLGADVGTGANLAARTKAAARVGGSLSAIGSLGNAPNTNDLFGTGANALLSAAAGAGLSAAAVPASEILANAARKLGPAPVPSTRSAMTAGGDATDELAPQNVNFRSVNASPVVDKASDRLLRGMERAGLTPSDAIARLNAIPADKPVSVMEIAGDQSHSLRQLGKWVARTPSAGQTQLRAAVAARAEPLPNAQRVLGDVGDALGQGRVNLVQQQAQLEGQQLAAAKPHYDVAFGDNTPPVPLSTKVEDGPALSDLLERPSIKSAIKFHNDIAAEKGQAPLELPANDAAASADVPPGFSPEQWAASKADWAKLGVTVPGTTTSEPSIPLKTLQTLKFKLDDALGFAKRYGQMPDGTPATNAKLGAINDTRVSLLGIMKQHSSDYGLGNEIWGGHAAMQDALDQGQNFLNRPISELQSQYPVMSAGQQQQHNIGALSGPMRDKIYNSSAVDRAKLLNSPDIQERLQVITQPFAQNTLKQNLATEHEIALTHQQIPNGSDTFENLANEAENGGALVKGVLSSLIRGSAKRAFGAVARGVVQPAVDNYVHGINEQTANALAPKLTAGMQSREDLMSVLDELAQHYDALRRQRPTPPFLGAATGMAVGQLSPGSRRDY